MMVYTSHTSKLRNGDCGFELKLVGKVLGL